VYRRKGSYPDGAITGNRKTDAHTDRWTAKWLPGSAGFLFGSIFDTEDGGDVFF
jgi:hypothetical protein